MFFVFLIPKAVQKTIAYIRDGQIIEIATPFISSTTTTRVQDNPIKTIVESVSSERTLDSSPFWLNSGAFFYSLKNQAQTIQGDLPPYSRWRLLYASSNPKDTDNGYHPQNVFRLITKAQYENFSQQIYVRVTKDNLSESENRNESNGIFLMSRYKDADNLYYTGIRVDGTAVIKEKVSGAYHTLAQKEFFPGDTYNKSTNPSLIPKHAWIGLKTEIKTLGPKTVVIKFYTDVNNSGVWEETLTATDTPEKGSPPLIYSGNAGVRTDFMDVEFRDYKAMSTTQI